MLIHRTGSDITAAWVRHFCMVAAAQQCAEEIITCAKTLCVPIGYFISLCRTGIYPKHVPGFVIHDGTKLAQNIHQGMNILYIRKVFNRAGFITQQGRRNDSDGGIFSTADLNRAFQGLATGDQHSVLQTVFLLFLTGDKVNYTLFLLS